MQKIFVKSEILIFNYVTVYTQPILICSKSMLYSKIIKIIVQIRAPLQTDQNLGPVHHPDERLAETGLSASSTFAPPARSQSQAFHPPSESQSLLFVLEKSAGPPWNTTILSSPRLRASLRHREDRQIDRSQSRILCLLPFLEMGELSESR